MNFFLEARNIRKTYARHEALRNVSIAVPPQSVFGLLGPNGAGKTSLIRIINQITAPDEGEVLFEGHHIKPEDVARIGYLPEERGLYKKMKVGEQCMYLAQLKGLSAADAKTKLKMWFNRFEISAWWDKKIEDLSKGMAQKVQFITTVLHEPQLLILDEPFSGFDPINAEMIREEMLRLKNEGATIILSTHDMGSVEELCDNIALINRAEVILNGSVKDIRNSFRTKTYRLEYEGLAMELGNALWANFELISNTHNGSHHVAEIQLKGDRKLNDLLGAIIPSVNLVSVNEIIPGMEEIFIQAVTQFDAQHA